MSDPATLTVCLMQTDALRQALESGGPLDPEALAETALIPLPPTELLSGASGWLQAITDAAGAPVTLDHFALTPRRAAGIQDAAGAWELDAFALAHVYQLVVWDDRAPAWHNEAGRTDSHRLLRQIHDMAFQAWKRHDDGMRLVVIEG